MVKVLVPIADGTEEMEAVIIIDMLRRAGINVTIASSEEIVTCSRGVRIIPDMLISNLNKSELFDAIILPGGVTGTDNLSKNTILIDILKKHAEKNKIIGAICAAPNILANHDIIGKDTTITSHPSIEKQLAMYKYSKEAVQADKNIITSRGAGTAFQFSLELITKLVSKEKAEEITQSIVLNNPGILL